jgi:hypothetical protein
MTVPEEYACCRATTSLVRGDCKVRNMQQGELSNRMKMKRSFWAKRRGWRKSPAPSDSYLSQKQLSAVLTQVVVF